MATSGNKKSGNLMILGDTGEEAGDAQKTFTETFRKDEAKTIYQFFQDKLKDIAEYGCVKIEPNNGPIDLLIIEHREGRVEDMIKLLNELKNELPSLPQKDITCPPNKKSALAEFLKNESTDDTDLLFLPDIAESKLKIIGKTQEKVNTAAHKFKVTTGEIKVTDRGARHLSPPREDKPSYSSIVSGNNENRSYQSSSYSSSKNKFSDSMSSSWQSSAGSSTDDFRFETKLNGNLLLKVYKASITRLDVEVIVNAANDTMMHGGGVARVISEAAGYKLDNESREHVDKNGPLGVSKNIVTTAGNLRYKAVIHAVGPMWHDYDRGKKIDCLYDLFDCVWNILNTCKTQQFKTVAMSAISAGIFAVPKELCADMYLYAAYKFSKSLSPTECPHEFHIVDVDTTILKLVGESVKRWTQDPESINPGNTLPKYLEKNPHQEGYSGYSSRGHRSHDGYRAGRRHRGGDGNQQYGRSYGDGVHENQRRHTSPSTQNENIEDKLEIRSSVSKHVDMRFGWGGNAKIFILDKQLTVMIYNGEISKLREIDAIVCGMGTDLETKGFIFNSLQKAGGSNYSSNLKKMKEKHRGCKPADVFKCEAGNLQVKYILHVVTNRIVDANTWEIQTYKDCVLSVLKKAKKNELWKLAIPLFSTGAIQTNKRKLKLCAEALLKVLDDFLVKNGDKNNITEIHLVNNSREVTDVIEEVFNDATGKKTTYSDRGSDEYKGKEDFSSTGRRGQSKSFQGDTERQSSDYGRSDSNFSHSERKVNYSGERNTSQNRKCKFGINDDIEDDDHYDTISDFSDYSPTTTATRKVDPLKQVDITKQVDQIIQVDATKQVDTTKKGDPPKQVGNLTIFDS